MDEDEVTFASLSNYYHAPAINIASPGTNIESIVPKHLIGQVSTMKSGTSISTGRNAAVTAAFKFRFPNKKPVESRTLLTNKLFSASPEIKTEIRNGDTIQYVVVHWVE